MVVDEEPEILNRMSEMLQTYFENIYCVTNAEDAWETFKTQTPFLIITDIILSNSKFDGFELIRKIKIKNPKVFIAALSDLSDKEILLKAFDNGFDNYILKPIQRPRVLKVIESAKQRYDLSKELETKRQALEDISRIGAIASYLHTDGDLNSPLLGNQFLEEIFGINCRDYTLGSFFNNHIFKEDQERFFKMRHEALQKSNPSRIEVKMIRSKGRRMDAEFIYTPTLDSNDLVIFNHVVIRDITELKQKEAELSFLFQSMPDGAWSINPETNVVFLTARWKEMLGYQDEELPNSLETFSSRLHPEDKKPILDHLQSVLNEKVDNFYGTFRLLNRNQEYQWFRARGRITVGKHDNSKRFIAIQEDLSDQLRIKSAEKRLQIYEKIISASPDLLSFLDMDRNYVAISQSYIRYTGKSEADIIGKKTQDLFGMKYYKKYVKENLDRAYLGENVTYYSQVPFPTGTKYFQVTYTPLKNSLNEIEGVVVNAHNLTEWKESQDALKTLTSSLESKVREKIEEIRKKEQVMLNQGRFASMGQMLNMIAHQWRQPLNFISSTVLNLRLFNDTEELNSEKLLNNLGMIEKQLQSMSETINDFMNFFKPDKSKQWFPLSKCALRTIELIKAQLDFHGIEIEVQIDSGLIVFGVENEFEHVLLNLLSNARDAIQSRALPPKKITLSGKNSLENIQVVVRDTGGGISNEILPQIFDPYFTTKDSSKGTGIGLYMSKILIEDHFSGQILVENDTEGAIFTIVLPGIVSHA